MKKNNQLTKVQKAVITVIVSLSFLASIASLALGSVRLSLFFLGLTILNLGLSYIKYILIKEL